jgi:hypothetical protein
MRIKKFARVLHLHSILQNSGVNWLITPNSAKNEICSFFLLLLSYMASKKIGSCSNTEFAISFPY